MKYIHVQQYPRLSPKRIRSKESKRVKMSFTLTISFLTTSPELQQRLINYTNDMASVQWFTEMDITWHIVQKYHQSQLRQISMWLSTQIACKPHFASPLCLVFVPKLKTYLFMLRGQYTLFGSALDLTPKQQMLDNELTPNN